MLDVRRDCCDPELGGLLEQADADADADAGANAEADEEAGAEDKDEEGRRAYGLKREDEGRRKRGGCILPCALGAVEGTCSVSLEAFR